MPTVLIVEDDRPICDLMTDILEDAGYNVVAAANGRRALHRLATLIPDLILTDIMMPEMDGLERCATGPAPSGEHSRRCYECGQSATRSVQFLALCGPHGTTTS
jgi:CheY-like chemotaxis protein